MSAYWWGLGPCGCPVAWSVDHPSEVDLSQLDRDVVIWVLLSTVDMRLFSDVYSWHERDEDGICYPQLLDWRPEACGRREAIELEPRAAWVPPRAVL